MLIRRAFSKLKPSSSSSSSSSSLSRHMTTTTTTTTPTAARPFHLAIPVNSIDKARAFYGRTLALKEGRSSAKWIDFDLFGSQLVVHWAGNEYHGTDYFNPVDGDEVPVPHFGACLSVSEFHEFSSILAESKAISFIIKPHLRFEGQPGEQYTMFFKDPFNNNLEFKAMTNPENLFAKYVVKEG